MGGAVCVSGRVLCVYVCVYLGVCMFVLCLSVFMFSCACGVCVFVVCVCVCVFMCVVVSGGARITPKTTILLTRNPHTYEVRLKR